METDTEWQRLYRERVTFCKMAQSVLTFLFGISFLSLGKLFPFLQVLFQAHFFLPNTSVIWTEVC